MMEPRILKSSSLTSTGLPAGSGVKNFAGRLHCEKRAVLHSVSFGLGAFGSSHAGPENVRALCSCSFTLDRSIKIRFRHVGDSNLTAPGLQKLIPHVLSSTRFIFAIVYNTQH
jgi:hypothetical protein